MKFCGTCQVPLGIQARLTTRAKSTDHKVQTMKAQLIPIKGGAAITLKKDITVVGRTDDCCDLVIDKTAISKLHCILVKTDGLLFVRDLGSTNGTKVNGQKVIRGALLPGDQLAFASIRYRVHLGPDADSEVPVDNHEMTEMIPILDVEDDLDDSTFDGFGNLDESLSDVRLLPDEEL